MDVSNRPIESFSRSLVKPITIGHILMIVLNAILLPLAYNQNDTPPHKTMWMNLLVATFASVFFVCLSLYFICIKKILHFWHREFEIKCYLYLLAIYLAIQILIFGSIIYVQSTIYTIANPYLLATEIIWIVFYVIAITLTCIIVIRDKENDEDTLPLHIQQIDSSQL